MLPKTCGLLLGLAVFLPAAQAQNMYCCQDPVTGRRSCGDVLPNQCKGLAYKILDKAGNVIKEVGPPLTPEQKAAKEAEERKLKEQEEALKEQRRKDAALLETYSSVNDIDLSLARAETEFKKAMQLAQEGIEEARKKRKKFEIEAEFYKNRELPPDVARGLRDADDEIRSLTTVLNSKKGDLENVRAKFAADKKRYLEILAGGGLFTHPDAKRQVEQKKK